MNFRTTLILIVALAAGLAFVLADRYWGKGAKDDETTAAAARADKRAGGRKLVDVTREDVTAVILTSPADNQTIELTKSGSDWKLVKPIDWPVETFQASGLVDDVLSLRSRGGVDLSGDNLSAAGLDKPRYTIEVRHARAVKSSDAGTVRRWLKKAGDAVSKGDAIAEVQADSDKRTITIEAPFDGKVGEIAIKESGTAAAQATLGTVEGTPVRLKVGAQHEMTSDLYVMSGDGKESWLATGGGLARRLDDKADKLVASLRDPKLVRDSGTSDVKQVEIIRDGQTLSFRREGGQWRMTAPEGMPADADKIDNVLRLVSGLRADAFVAAGSAEAERAGIDHPLATVWYSTLAPSTRPSETRPAGVTVTFGQFETLKKEKIYVQASGSNALAKVGIVASDWEMLSQAGPLGFRDRKVTDVEPATVSDVTIVTDQPATTQPTTRPAKKTTVVLTRRKELEKKPAVDLGATPPVGVAAPASRPATQAVATTRGAGTRPAVAATLPAEPKSTWELTSANKADADDAAVDAVLGALHPLRASKYLEPSETPTTQPAATHVVTLHTVSAGGAKTGTHELRITDRGSEKNPVGSFGGLTFEVDRDLLAKLTADFTWKPARPAEPPMPGPMPGMPSFHP